MSNAVVSTGLGRFWNPRSLRFTLPIAPGDAVLLVGAAPTLAQSLDSAGVTVFSVLTPDEAAGVERLPGRMATTDGDTLPCGDNEVDHVLVPRLAEGYEGLVPGELARILRPGGGLFLGTGYRLRSKRVPATSLRAGRHMLARAGFTDIEVYGVRYNLAHPRHLVPLSSRAALLWYLDSAYLPRSRKGAIALHVAKAATRFGALPPLFPALGFVACKEPGSW